MRHAEPKQSFFSAFCDGLVALVVIGICLLGAFLGALGIVGDKGETVNTIHAMTLLVLSAGVGAWAAGLGKR